MRQQPHTTILTATLACFLLGACAPTRAEQLGAPAQPTIQSAGRSAEVAAKVSRLTFSQQPSPAEFLRLGLFALPLVPVGPSNTEDNRDLAQAVLAYDTAVREQGSRDADTALSSFVQTHPTSAWNPALLVNLGTIYRQTGHFSKALRSWRSAWMSTKAAQDSAGHAIGDAAAGQLSQLLAYLGRKDELAPLLDELRVRPLRGTAAELVSESSRGLADMLATPEFSFKCGPYALARILEYQNPVPDKQSLAFLQATHSTARGLSLVAVRAMSDQAGMHYQMAFRNPGARVVLPAVAHWKVGHYAALVDQETGRYRIQDPTFGEDIRMSLDTLEEEASGYFLIPAGALPQGWRTVTAAEGGRVWGSGDTGNNKDNGATGANDAGGFASSGGSCPGGCTTWNVEPMVVSLSLRDVPVGYQTSLGPSVQFDLHYSQRDVQQPQVFNYANLGRKWTTSWLSYVTDNTNVNGTVELYRRGGGNETFSFDAGMSASRPGPFSQTTLSRISDAAGATTGFIRQFADGSAEEFKQAFGTKFFMTAVADPYGNAVKLSYDAQLRLVSLSDALGQLTTLAYELVSDPLKITKVTDPFGRSATFTYTADGALESITDTLGITSQYTYGAGDFISALETPYGKTSFEYGDSFTNKDLGNTRYLNITDALGRTSRVEFRQGAPGVAASGPPMPQGMSIQNDFLQWRNTFLWNALQYAEASKNGGLDYSKARVLHWLHTSDNSTARVPESVKDPLESRIWFDYPGQTLLHVGTSSQPLHVGRVLDGGASQVASFEYNAQGKVTLTVDPQGRTFSYEYADNGIDLVAVSSVSAGKREKLVSLVYDDKHRPTSVTAANGATSRYEYNERRQLTKISDALGHVTTLVYDARAGLTAIEGPSGARFSFTYDDQQRLASASDPSGDSVRYEYDAADRLTRVLFGDGTSNEYSYKLLDLNRIKDRQGNVTELVFDAERQLTQLVDALGQRAKFGYGLDRRLASISDASGQLTSITRDLQGRALSKQVPGGNSVSVSYESGSSRVHSLTDPQGQTTSYEYNVDDSIAKVMQGSALQPPAAISFAYDALYARVLSMTDAIGVTKYTYNPLSSGQPGAGELAEVSTPVAGANGQNDIIRYRYDVLGQILSQTINDSEETASYDALGRVSKLANPLDVFTLAYSDATERAQAVASTHGPKTTLSYYDAKQHGRVKRFDVARADGTPLAHFGYQYDARGLLQAFAESYQNDDLPDLVQAADSGALLSPPRRDDGSAQADGPAPRNPALFLALATVLALWMLVVRRRVAPVLAALVMPLMAAGSCSEPRLHASSTIAAQVHRYQYDAIARLTSAMNESGSGNVAAAGGKVAGVSSALTAPSGHTYNYDTRSNVTSITAQGKTAAFEYTDHNTLAAGSYDKNGSPTRLDGDEYSWDAANRLVKIVRGEQQSEFSYDGLQRLVRIVEKQRGKVVADHAYTWCGSVRCLERDNLQPGAPVSKQYFGQGFVAAGKRFYYVLDHLGSVRQLLDETGRVRAQYDYDPYGRVSKQRGDLDSDLRYAGYFQHAPSGLALALYRAYDPTHGRWLNPDPLGEAGDLNPYAYAAGNPVNSTDPLGLWAGVDDAIAVGAGALVGVVVQGGVDLYHGQLSSWQDYTAAAVGGAAGGEAALYTGPVGAGAAAGAASNLTRQGLNWASGKSCGFNATSFVVETALGAAGGAVAKGVGKLIPAGATGEAIATAPPKRVFWSGGDASKEAAAAFAQRGGGTTLEMTSVGQQLEQTTQSMTWADAKPLWENASKEFADGASGQVDVFLGRANPNSVWSKIERDALKANPNVSKVRIHLTVVP